MNRSVIAALCLLLAGCASHKDYDATEYCENEGIKPGDVGFDNCMQEAKTNRMLEQQQQEYDQMKQQQQDYRMQPNNGAGTFR